uniref:ALA1 n=1 Tax=Arundo donax TaxID=35708 RepID=A0A0A9CVX4_ARUDO
MTQIHVATMLPHIVACVIQFYLMTSIARWMLTRMSTDSVQRSPRLEPSITLFRYAG